MKLPTQNIKTFNAQNSNSHSKGSVSISIINTKSNGKRIKLSSSLWNSLENSEYVNLIIDENGVFIVPNENGIKVCKGGIIYNAEAVITITSNFGLDFSNTTSMSFSASIENDDEKNQKFAFIKMSK